ncbi:hypothetical protein DNU06_15065 [Putridiphycobacter roseus]|uniref:Uncharacterized protein n=1 Tax=Putridiphycobacter roseus TaxID=2219161 RepID=A0A2W1ND17_9FLAO|nr:hypothetical protein [Putridiphycobacter roseus]PZE15966.1 hypothetical protein DNU06_15065 [Putridiphycobacter roseus]
MHNKIIFQLTIMGLFSFYACSQNNDQDKLNHSAAAVATVKTEPHSFGGWYCPDNLNGFPAVDISDWQNVPVVHDRLPTKSETQNGTSLIYIDQEKYPNAKPIVMPLPRLAKYYNHSSKREDYIIVIQAIQVQEDSVVGFRLLNGGNGSARWNEIQWVSTDDIKKIPVTQFVSIQLPILASPDKIWDVMTKPENAHLFKQVLNQQKLLKPNWRSTTNVNYFYGKNGTLTANYAALLFGNYYIQNDYQQENYTEKFLLVENKETNQTELKIVCGPFAADFDVQKTILMNWAKQVKLWSEAP